MSPEYTHRVIIVEDDLDVKDIIREAALLSDIKREEILEAESMEKVLATIQEKGLPKLAILDLFPSTRDDFQTIRTLTDKGVKVLVLSGDARPGTKQACLDYGAIGYMDKPFELEELINNLKLLSSYNRPES